MKTTIQYGKLTYISKNEYQRDIWIFHDEKNSDGETYRERTVEQYRVSLTAKGTVTMITQQKTLIIPSEKIHTSRYLPTLEKTDAKAKYKELCKYENMPMFKQNNECDIFDLSQVDGQFSAEYRGGKRTFWLNIN